MRVLLLSAYAAQSHVHWQDSLRTMFPEWSWQVLSLPPRHFSWRVRGNPLYWALQEREVLERGYDLLVTTSMVDLATLRGLVPALASVPTVVYFHENQFDYPQDQQRHSLLEAQMVSLYSALAANRVVFNSHYNRETFCAGCAALLRRLPDFVPSDIPTLLRDKSTVVPVPLAEMIPIETMSGWPGRFGTEPSRPLRLLWLGRFEHDKGGEGLFEILSQLEDSALDYELAMVGQQFRNSPEAFNRIERDFSHRLVHVGYVERAEDYQSLLRAADIALSTALHEFQGLAILEAVAAGCVPVVPDRLAYREIYPESLRYASIPSDPIAEAAAAMKLVQSLAAAVIAGERLAPDISAYCPAALKPQYSEVFDFRSDTARAG
jgi:glycosyltransferase involved in cell wall biosynthesis